MKCLYIVIGVYIIYVWYVYNTQILMREEEEAATDGTREKQEQPRLSETASKIDLKMQESLTYSLEKVRPWFVPLMFSLYSNPSIKPAGSSWVILSLNTSLSGHRTREMGGV